MPSPERILIVDDEQVVREIIAAMLTGAGYVVHQASSGTEALAILLAEGEFDLVLSDLMMEEIDGMVLMERSRDKFPDMLVIMVTAVHDISVALFALRNGAYDYLLKPFERQQLLVIVRRALEHRRLKLENRAYQENLEALVMARTGQVRQSLSDLERSYDITLELAGDLMGFKDPDREAHAKRVTSFAVAIGRAMGLDSDRIRVIARGAFLHDLGMIGVPDRILHKPGPLTPEETEMMREHCYRGYKVLKKIPYLQEASEIVYAHEEWYDGSGYPRGLKGDEIPLGARIFAVAHALDAITTDWEYRTAQTLEAARQEISRLSGSQFDPEIVKVFMELKEKVWNDLRQEVDQRTE
jgi:response regulator RpfG family c-di-GMP phosphodiesterase